MPHRAVYIENIPNRTHHPKNKRFPDIDFLRLSVIYDMCLMPRRSL
jgi:hypothetical protein